MGKFLISHYRNVSTDLLGNGRESLGSAEHTLGTIAGLEDL